MADFWAGYISGALGIIIGNPLDLIKVRLQAAPAFVPISTLGRGSISSQQAEFLATLPLRNTYVSHFSNAGSLIRGATAPILGYGALNALLFVTYNRTSDFLNSTSPSSVAPSLWTTWMAGAVGGLATWVVSTPTELVKCRAQMAPISTPMAPSISSTSWQITRDIIKTEGIKGLYFGGIVTALRDSIGYGFYFWSYQLCSRFMTIAMNTNNDTGQTTPPSASQEAAKVLLCGGLAGVVTWASIFPLDVIKTRVQTQYQPPSRRDGETVSLLRAQHEKRLGSLEIAKIAFRQEGISVFFRGLMVCSVRAFIVNAVQWAVYEWIMQKLKKEDISP